MEQLNQEVSNKNLPEMRKLIDSIEHQAKQTIWHCDTNKLLLKEQQISLCDQVRSKNAIMQKQNNQISANSKKSIKIKTSIKSQKKSFTQFYKTSLQTTNDKIYDMNKDNSINESNPPKKRMFADSLLLSMELKSIDSLIEIKDKELDESLGMTREFEKMIQNQIELHQLFSEMKLEKSFFSLITRSYGADNYDFYIHEIKDSLVYLDSIHALDMKLNNKNIIDSLMTLFRVTNKHAGSMLSLYTKRGSIFKKLKTKSVSGSGEMVKLYQANLQSIITFSKNYYDWLNSNQSFYSYLNGPAKTISKNSKRTLKWLTTEGKFKQNTKAIMDKQRALTKLSDIYNKRAVQQLKDAEKLKIKFNIK